jgi:hypothetical protein
MPNSLHHQWLLCGVSFLLWLDLRSHYASHSLPKAWIHLLPTRISPPMTHHGRLYRFGRWYQKQSRPPGSFGETRLCDQIHECKCIDEELFWTKPPSDYWEHCNGHATYHSPPPKYWEYAFYFFPLDSRSVASWVNTVNHYQKVVQKPQYTTRLCTFGCQICALSTQHGGKATADKMWYKVVSLDTMAPWRCQFTSPVHPDIYAVWYMSYLTKLSYLPPWMNSRHIHRIFKTHYPTTYNHPL